MTLLTELVVRIVGDVSDFTAAIDQANGVTQGFAGSALDGLSALGGGIVMGGLAAGAAGALALGAATREAVLAAQEAEAIQAQLGSVLRSTGGAAGVTADMANELAASLESVTMFEDDAIVAGESMLLTFTNIGKDVFPDTTKVMLDMSQALGQDMKSSAMQLGKALNDPVAGVSALSRVGVTFTESQKEMIKTLVDTGDVAGAQKVILAELNKEFGGSAEAAGQTSEGVWTRLQNVWGGVQEQLGGALLPLIVDVGNKLATALADPETQAMIEQLANWIGEFAQNVITNFPLVLQWFQDVFGWLQDNQGLIVAVLAVVGAALLAFAYTSLAAAIPGLIAFVTASWPVLLVIGLIGGAAYLLYEAWTNNWGGIQEKTAEVLAWLEPKIQVLVDWLQKNVPVALALLNLKWMEFQNQMAIVWSWVDAHLMPLFEALGDLLGVTLGSKVVTLAGVFDTVLKPVLEYAGWAFDNLKGILTFLAPYIGDYVSWAFGNLTSIIDGITGSVGWLADALGKLSLPSWLTPGSPTPWEIGLWGIGGALKSLSGVELPAFSAELALQPVGAAGLSSARGMVSRSGSVGGSGGISVPVTFNYADNALLSVSDEHQMAKRLGPMIANVVGVELERSLKRKGL